VEERAEGCGSGGVAWLKGEQLGERAEASDDRRMRSVRVAREGGLDACGEAEGSDGRHDAELKVWRLWCVRDAEVLRACLLIDDQQAWRREDDAILKSDDFSIGRGVRGMGEDYRSASE
jgi:hypothetical protein